MGHRANLITVDEHGYRLFYSHWAAASLPQDLFWGPEHAHAYVHAHQEEEADELLDCVLGEGGALIDHHRRVLLIFGSGGVATDIPFRRFILHLMRFSWPGWSIQWADTGMLAIADYLDIDDEDLVYDALDLDWNPLESLAPPDQPYLVNLICSMTREDGSILIYPLSGYLDNFLEYGPGIIDLAGDYGIGKLDLSSWDEDFPQAGWHIDIPNKMLAFWMGMARDNLAERIEPRWPGWTIVPLDDSFESQVAETGDRLIMPPRSQEQMIDWLESILLEEERFDGATALLGMLARQKEKGETPEVDPRAFRDPPDPLPSLRIRNQIFDDVMRKAGISRAPTS